MNVQVSTIHKRQQKLSCKLLGHQLKVVKQFKQGHNEYCCKWCKNQFTDIDNGRVDFLTPKLHNLNRALEKLYSRKMRIV